MRVAGISFTHRRLRPWKAAPACKNSGENTIGVWRAAFCTRRTCGSNTELTEHRQEQRDRWAGTAPWNSLDACVQLYVYNHQPAPCVDSLLLMESTRKIPWSLLANEKRYWSQFMYALHIHATAC